MLEYSTAYTFEHSNIDGELGIKRNIRYVIWDNDFKLFKLSERKLSKRRQRIPVKSEQHTLLVSPPIEHESLPAAEQVWYGTQFDQILNENNHEFLESFHHVWTQSSIVATLGILRFIKSGHKLPDQFDDRF